MRHLYVKQIWMFLHRFITVFVCQWRTCVVLRIACKLEMYPYHICVEMWPSFSSKKIHDTVVPLYTAFCRASAYVSLRIKSLTMLVEFSDENHAIESPI